MIQACEHYGALSQATMTLKQMAKDLQYVLMWNQVRFHMMLTQAFALLPRTATKPAQDGIVFVLL